MIKLSSPLVRGFTSGVILLGILGIIVGLLMYFTNLPESVSPLLTLSIFIFSVFVGGFLAARRQGSKGLLLGFEMALAFIILVLVINLVFNPGHFSWTTSLIKFLLAALAGILGGIMGVAFHQK
ncbi:MAG: TIGR04086 family membrane protein [Bacillota bacterium]|jgi:putative membrane protein (TIGR04086 family)